MKKVSTIGRLQKECDRLLQEAGRKKNRACEACGEPSQVLHHFYPKSTSSRLRYDWDNLIFLCHGCHMRHHQAGDPRIHGTVIKKRGMAWYELLAEKKKEMIKVDKYFYMVVRKRLSPDTI